MPEYEQLYARPPITEAVIELRFGAEADYQVLTRIKKALATVYPGQQELEQGSLKVEIREDHAPSATPVDRFRFFRLASDNQQEIAIIAPRSLLISEIAPYSGWPRLIKRLHREWAVWISHARRLPIQRLGVRYINRIDVPHQPRIEDDEYVTVGVKAPVSLGATVAYSAQAVFPVDSIKSNVTISSSVALPPPVPGFISIMLDIDVGREIEPPQRDDAMFDLLEEIHTIKNDVFEKCITDKARRLFQ